MFTFLIFFATLVCVNLSNIAKINTQQALNPFKSIFNFMVDLVAFDFKRKQNLNQQQKRKATTRFIKFSKSNVTKK
jgi:hypothetical protein